VADLHSLSAVNLFSSSGLTLPKGEAMTPFRVTYDVVTPESAEHGDVADSGYYARGGHQCGHDEPSQWTLHEVVSEFGRHSFEDSGHWFSSVYANEDYRTGESTSYAVHPPQTITAASYARLRRILCYRNR
jgi:hypothetical protein